MNAMNALSARYGIQDTFRDARGTVQETSDATRKALLVAMGVRAENEAAAIQALDKMDREEWGHPVPPVHVVVAAQSSRIPITYPAGTGKVSWQLRLEDGTERAGDLRFQSLELLQSKAFAGEKLERRALVFETSLPMGYHRLRLAPSDAETTLIVSPGRCWLPEEIEQGEQIWGVAAQLYLLTSESNWGIGDFTDLAQLARMLVDRGASVIGLNPLHAMFPDNPEHASPYSPASRLLLNVLNIDVSAAAESSGCVQALEAMRREDFVREIRACQAATLVDYQRIARLKLPLLEVLFQQASSQRHSAEWQAFESFRRDASESFERHCLFLALRAHFASKGADLADWKRWPADFQSPDTAAVRRFSMEQSEQVTYQAWLQFIADRQLSEAARAAKPMAVGLYRDLAVGADASGAETWSNQQAVVSAAQVGAPPDIYNPAGQDWGLPPFHPVALQEERYRSFIDLVRANMRHAGGLRIDHVMALQQLYWVPKGSSAAEGAYVRYPMEDLIAILALESHRNRCLVVGEDLGTVPEGFRERMTEARILSYRVLFFEKTEEGFIAPDGYPPLSLAVAGSHDLPTLSAWLAGSDIALKKKLNLYPSEQLHQDAQSDRASDRKDLMAAFREQGLPANLDMTPDEFADAAHRFLVSTASAITVVQLDDITRETTPVNIPATSTQHANWRRRLTLSLAQMNADSQFGTLSKLLNEARNIRP